MTLLNPDFWERTALPFVIAFGLGVIAHDLGGEHRVVGELRTTQAALVVAQEFADACAPYSPPMELDTAYAVVEVE